MSNLDLILPTGGLAPADYGVVGPVNAWPDASDEVFVNARWLPNGTLMQIGWNAGSTTVWQRLRAEDGTFSSWTKLQTRIDTADGGAAYFADGAEAMALPDYTKLAFTQAAGIASVEAGDLRLSEGGNLIVEVRVSVLHNWGSSVVFGYAINGGTVAELGRVQVNSVDPVLVIERGNVTLPDDALLSLYVSSDFEWSEFSWSGGEILILKL